METVTISKKEYQKLLEAKKVGSKKTKKEFSDEAFGILRDAPSSVATRKVKRSTSMSIHKVKSYVFRAQLEQEKDGRWSAWISTLPGCATLGRNQGEALGALREAAQAYLEVLVKYGQSIPMAKTVETINAPVIAVTL
ncbi:MAG: type II toxin-antitoxin system HicB family antitoxin [Candidatus Sungbacteria bacterium]|nr:type II toxin-antitoxin system HicB family antitoxin [Candidatus Sungbacteria bacterium]